LHDVPFGPKPGKRKTRAPAGPLDKSHVLEGVKDPFNGVFHRENKAGAELSRGLPAFMRVGVLGKKSRELMRS
jgi:hypothetical protein